MPYFPKVKFDSQSTVSVVFLENVTLKVVAPWFNHSRFLENRKSYHDGGIKIPNLTGSKQLSWKIRGSFCQLTVVWLNNFVRLPNPRNEEHELWNKICWLMWIETGSYMQILYVLSDMQILYVLSDMQILYVLSDMQILYVLSDMQILYVLSDMQILYVLSETKNIWVKHKL